MKNNVLKFISLVFLASFIVACAGGTADETESFTVKLKEVSVYDSNGAEVNVNVSGISSSSTLKIP